MMIQIGDRLPTATLYEMTPDGPQSRQLSELVHGRRVVMFGLPGAFTPTCSARHLPGYLEQVSAFKAKGVDEVLCISVNDAYVMGAWGKDQKVDGRVRLLADGSAKFSKAAGLDVDLTERGMGVRSRRYSLYAEDGVVRAINVEQPGKFEVSDAGSMLIALDRLQRE